MNLVSKAVSKGWLTASTFIVCSSLRPTSAVEKGLVFLFISNYSHEKQNFPFL